MHGNIVYLIITPEGGSGCFMAKGHMLALNKTEGNLQNKRTHLQFLFDFVGSHELCLLHSEAI